MVTSWLKGLMELPLESCSQRPSSVVGDKDGLPSFEIGAVVELDGEATLG